MVHLDTPQALSKTGSSAAMHTTVIVRLGYYSATQQGKYSAYAFLPLSDWSPESADHLATTQSKNQRVCSHAQASKKLQGKEKERKKKNKETCQVFG